MSKKLNTNLWLAKKEKNDEFYTQLSDIEKEMRYYKKYFDGKIVLCNCDDPKGSQFWEYFSRNFDHLKLKKLISTHYVYSDLFTKNNKSYKLEIIRGIDVNGDGRFNDIDTIKTELKGDGDFRSPECIELLKECDIVVTNPPFSLFREYMDSLTKYKKKFLIIGSMNAITYKETFKLIKDNKIWLGYNKVNQFIKPDGEIKKFGNIGWYTNLETKKRNEEIILYKKYDEKEYPKYDNYDAIEVSRVKNIPMDYDGAMGVSITFLDKYNPKQFEILGIDRYIEGNTIPNKRFFINGKEIYARIIIKNRKVVKQYEDRNERNCN